jgi:hypothetical protein
MKLRPVPLLSESKEFIYQYLNVIHRNMFGTINIVKKDYKIIFVNCICPLLLIYYVLSFQE